MDQYYRDLDEEYRKLRRVIKDLTDQKNVYEEELRKNEMLRLKRAMMIPPEKERDYIRQIDALKLECAELRAENYNLGEKFIK